MSGFNPMRRRKQAAEVQSWTCAIENAARGGERCQRQCPSCQQWWPVRSDT